MSKDNENTGRGNSGRGKGNNRGRGYGGGGRGRQRFTRRLVKDLDSNKNVPMLTFGTNTTIQPSRKSSPSHVLRNMAT